MACLTTSSTEKPRARKTPIHSRGHRLWRVMNPLLTDRRLPNSTQIQYKAEKFGTPVSTVNFQKTSTECHTCGENGTCPEQAQSDV
ncbi:zinc ribbon domain-containing protein [Halopiger aswanensis]|uniref:zinc ribbon domain-containing protein n=1 Tax=Halopiger aswanensis TaxID=148449 RepID=UPI000E70E882